MRLRTVCLLVVAVAAISIHQSEAAPKFGLLKAKLALKKAPYVIAHMAVAKEVKTKAKIAAVKSLAAIKASHIAALSAVTAPFRVIKKTIALKAAGVKAAKALKIAKLAAAAQIVKNLKKSPIILPVPVAVPAKDLELVGSNAGLGAGVETSLGAGLPAAIGAALPSLGGAATSSLNPLPGIISGAQRAIQTAGANIPFLSSLTGGLDGDAIVASEIVPTAAPTYRFVPEVGFSNYNQASYEPHIEVEVPSAVPY